MAGRSHESYGQRGVSWVDRLGVWLSGSAIRRHLPAKSRLDVVELGCGFRATQLIGIRDRLAHGTGVDFSIAPECRELPGFTFIEAPIEVALAKLAASAFDVVLLISVLEHLPEPDDVLREIHGRLRPGGVLLVNVPTWRGKGFLEFSAFRLGWSPKVEMDDHKMYYDKRDLWPKLVTAGFLPSRVRLRYHKLGLNLFAIATK
ncbi:hypothetical protein DB347_11300 [Opitutaceae bacterium EW11]|nr:hypothetical protein DB347_11300 [Opitutaceae bacterium EW11]